jgi:hypothetical protein
VTFSRTHEISFSFFSLPLCHKMFSQLCVNLDELIDACKYLGPIIVRGDVVFIIEQFCLCTSLFLLIICVFLF